MNGLLHKSQLHSLWLLEAKLGSSPHSSLEIWQKPLLLVYQLKNCLWSGNTYFFGPPHKGRYCQNFPSTFCSSFCLLSQLSDRILSVQKIDHNVRQCPDTFAWCSKKVIQSTLWSGKWDFIAIPYMYILYMLVMSDSTKGRLDIYIRKSNLLAAYSISHTNSFHRGVMAKAPAKNISSSLWWNTKWRRTTGDSIQTGIHIK